ncbi:sulfatase-like hydrolase/transferase [Streptococcus suis]|nr:sulfatase-like hydrolase/transferase [Streptococcus suis]
MIATYSEADFKTGFIYLFDLFTQFGMPLTMISLGYLYAASKHSFSNIIKIWGYTVLAGLSVVCGLLIGNRTFYLSMLYNTLFPIVRDSYHEITALLVLVFFMPVVQNFVQRINHTAFLSILSLLFGLGVVFNRDIFLFGNGNNISYHLAMGMIGVYLYDNPDAFKKKDFFLGLVVSSLINVCLNLAMPFISMTVHYDLSTADRFNTVTSLFSVVAIISTFGLLHQLSLPRVPRKEFLVSFTVTALVASSNSYLLAYIVGLNNLFTKSYTIYKLIFATIDTIVLFGVFSIFYLLLESSITWLNIRVKISRQFDNLSLFQFNDYFCGVIKTILSWICFYKKEFIFGVVLYILSFVSLLAMNLTLTLSLSTVIQHNAILYTFFARQNMILANMLALLVFYGFLRALTNRFWLSSILISLLMLFWIIVSRLKMQVRGEPIMPSEAKMLSAYGSLLSMVDIKIIFTIVSVTVIFLVGIIYLEWKKPAKKISIRRRIAYIGFFITFCVSTIFLNHEGGIVNTISQGIDNNPRFNNQAVAVQTNGPLIQFLNNLDVEVMGEPEGYSPERMKEIAERYRIVAQDINATRTNHLADQTVIFNLSESFVDPNRLGGVSTKTDPIPYFHSLIESQLTSGTMISPGYGGGTANIEYMTLTGFSLANFSPTLVTPYTQLVSTLNHATSFNQYFTDSTAIHTYTGVYYSRIATYQKFGFGSFMYEGSEDELKYQERIDRSTYLSDRTAYLNTLDVIESKNGGHFVQLVSMQNHYPYNLDFYDDQTTFVPSGGLIVNDDIKQNATNYLTGLNYTDQALKEFIEKINAIEKPITLVFYGDHLPGIFPLDATKQGLLMHSTDYFIYSNPYAKAHGAVDVTDQTTNYIGPNDFIALTLKQTNSKVDAFGALLTRVQETLPALSTNTSEIDVTVNAQTQLTNELGQPVLESQLSQEQRNILEDYRLVQYDLNAGNGYLFETNFIEYGE